MQLFDLPPVWRAVGLLLAKPGAFHEVSPDRHLHVGRQGNSIPSLPRLRLHLPLVGSEPFDQSHGRQRAIDGSRTDQAYQGSQLDGAVTEKYIDD